MCFFSVKTTWFANNKSTKQPKFSEGVGLQSVGRNFWMPHYPYFGSPALYFCVFGALNGALNGLTVGWGARGKKRTFPILKELFLKENLWGFFREGCVVCVCVCVSKIRGDFLMFFFVFSFQKGSNPTFCTKILSYDNNQRSVWEALSKKFTGRSAAVDKTTQIGIISPCFSMWMNLPGTFCCLHMLHQVC